MLSSTASLFRIRCGVRGFATAKPKFSRDAAPVILSAARTPIGGYQGALSSLSGPQLGAVALKDALSKSKVDPKLVEAAIFGNVISAGVGQNPARQAVLSAGLPESVVSTTLNKVCSSGMKALMFGAQEILTGQYSLLAVGGFESMSNVPYYLTKARKGYGYGNGEVIDGIIHDGLWDVYTKQHMGSCAEVCASKYGFSREMQDAHALESYRRATEATKSGAFKSEIAPVTIQGKAGPQTVSEDEEPKNLKADKVPTLRTAFKKEGGTITAANSSKINDGAAALIIAQSQFAQSHNLTPVGRILGFADAEQNSVEFTTAPSLAIPRAIANAGLTASDIEYYEINEAFSVVALANQKIMGLNPERVNIFGGAVALGHPVGCSGARVIVTLLNVLKQRNARYGVAGICNGGGGASAVVVERL